MDSTPEPGGAALLIKTGELDRRIAHGEPISAVYPQVLETINELTDGINKQDVAAPRLAISEALRLIDLYADRNEATLIEKMRNKAAVLVPVAVENILQAA
jgi:hypothetical protein